MVEVSEIHIGSILAGGDVFVSLQLPTGEERRTEAIKRTDGGFLRFSEMFTFNVRTSDAPFSLIVSEGPGRRLAHYQMPARELVNLAKREHREYFRCELVPGQAFPASGRNKKPYAAMRIRKVTSPANSTSA